MAVLNRLLVTNEKTTARATMIMTIVIQNCTLELNSIERVASSQTKTATTMPMITSWVCDMSGHHRYWMIWIVTMIRNPSTDR